MASPKYDTLFSEEQIKAIQEDYVVNELSIRDIQRKYNIKCKEWIRTKPLKGLLRNYTESNSIAHKKYPDRYKHSEETKKKMSQKRLEYMKEHPECTAWRKRNEPSYPEKMFIEFIEKYEYDKNYLIEREYPVFPFFIDFAFLPIKLAVEIDGSQHERDKERVLKDEEKNKVLINNGWKVLRITENLIKTDWDEVQNKLEEFISSDEIKLEKVGIFTYQELNKKPKRKKGEITAKMAESFYKQRKVTNRPSKEELECLVPENSFTYLGKKFGVNGNTIKKWCKRYGLPFRKKDLITK